MTRTAELLTSGVPELARWRRILFTVVTAVVALFFAPSLANALAPWLGEPPLGELAMPEIHLWHSALPGAVRGVLVVGVLIALLRRPERKPLLVQWLILSLAVGLPLVVPFAGLLGSGVPLVLVVAAYPWPRALADVSVGRRSGPLLALAAAATILLVPVMWRELGWQLAGVGGEHAATSHWATDVQGMAILLAAMWLAGTGRPGARVLSLLSGAVLIYLGVVAVTFPAQAGSWGVAGGVLAILGGSASIAESWLRRTRGRGPAGALERTG